MPDRGGLLGVETATCGEPVSAHRCRKALFSNRERAGFGNEDAAVRGVSGPPHGLRGNRGPDGCQLCVVRTNRWHRSLIPFRARGEGPPDLANQSAVALVSAAFFAAAERFDGPLVRTASLAEAERSAAVRRLALARACLDRAADDTIWWPSPFSFFFIARERLGFGALSGCLPRRISRAACSRTPSEVVPFGGGGSFTPARRALESPMAMACSVERAPCFPARMCSISSRTNSPACVDSDFPSRLSLCRRASVFLSGMTVDRSWSSMLEKTAGSCRRDGIGPAAVTREQRLMRLGRQATARVASLGNQL